MNAGNKNKPRKGLDGDSINYMYSMNKIVLFICFFSFTLMAKSQTADFAYATTNGLFCNPSTIQFKETATGTPTSFFWQFGDGTASNQPNPVATYSSAGTFTVKLIVVYPGGATATAAKTITINSSIPPTINASKNAICAPGTITFDASGSGSISNYSWDFGDGTTLNSANNSTSHNFTSFAVDTVTLNATYSTGCMSSNQTVITIAPPKITGIASPTSGCVPQNVNFTANVTAPAGSTATNYSWNFGDGSPILITQGNTAMHTYTNPGKYSPTVTVTTIDGCTNSYTYNGIGFGIPPTNRVTYAVNPVICGSDTAIFVGKANNITQYYYNFGDGTSVYVTDTIAYHKFATLGPKSIYFLPLNNGCYSPAIYATIKIIGVIASYNYTNGCADKNTFTFQNTSQGNLTSITWDFGDGSPVVHTLNATHSYPPSGNFVTTLTVADSVTGCSDNYHKVIHTGQPALVNADSIICINTNTTFSVSNNPDTSAQYTWYIDGKQSGPSGNSSYPLYADSLGNFSNYVIINHGPTYCADTVFLGHSFIVRGPALGFTAPASLCINNPYTVNDTSRPFLPADSIVSWNWNFGDQTANENTYQPQPHTYANAGSYTVTLSAADMNGCVDTLTDTVKVHALPFIFALPRVDTLCAGSPDTLYAFSGSSLQWSPAGSLSCATCDTVINNATSNTTYHILATTPYGCTATDSILVKAYSPFTASSMATNSYICLNDTIHLNADPPGKKIVWSPANGLSDPNIYGPVASPVQNTTYTATLTDSVGCFTSSTSITVQVKGLPTVDAGADQFYAYNSPFSINPVYSSNVAAYLWTPGSVLSCSTCPNPNGVALSANTFYIKVTSDSGCVATDSVKIYIECKDSYLLVPNAFTPNGDNINDYFYPITRGIKTITRFSVYNRFGKLVYEATNFPPNNQAFGWNGQLNGAGQQSDVFVYYLEALCDSGEKLLKKGSVVLIR